MSNGKLLALMMVLLSLFGTSIQDKNESRTTNKTKDYEPWHLGVVDAWSICVPPKNTCDQDKSRCRLNETIAENTLEPLWVGKLHRDLVEKTINDTRSEIHKGYSPTGSSPYGRVCYDSVGILYWETAWHMDPEYKDCIPGYISAGYHPFGTKPGYWLFQVMSLTDNLRWTGFENHTLIDGFFVSLVKISDAMPVEFYFDVVSSVDEWESRDRNDNKRSNKGMPSRARNRTDQDLIKNGFDYRCCSSYGKATSMTFYGQVKCQNFSLIHQQCSNPISEQERDRFLAGGTWNSDHWSAWEDYPTPDCPGVVKPRVSAAGGVVIGLGYCIAPILLIILFI